MIGEIHDITTPFYNAATRKNEYKKRPALVIGVSDDTEYNILPISKVSKRCYLDPYYDVLIDPYVYKLLKLKDISYVRIHKQTTAHQAIMQFRSNMKASYEDLWLDIVSKLDEYNAMLINNVL